MYTVDHTFSEYRKKLNYLRMFKVRQSEVEILVILKLP